MRIFTSYHYVGDQLFIDEMHKTLHGAGYRAYPKQLRDFFGERNGLYEDEELDEYLRDEELAIIVLSNNFLQDRWLVGELHALLRIERKLRPDFVLPVILEGVDEGQLPPICITKPHVDFRGKTREEGFAALLQKLTHIASRPQLSVFVSHSSKDEKIAAALSDLLMTAFNLTNEQILCTSVGGYRLSMGINTSEALRRKIREAKAFICIATENSLGGDEKPGSFYVAVELGARWNLRRPLTVMLAAGASGHLLKPPFNELNSLSCEDVGQVQQFITQIAPIIGNTPKTPQSYQRALENLVDIAKGGDK